MPSILVIYASTHGHTHKIALRIVDRLRSAGADVTLHNIDVANLLALDTYDAIVVGASVHAGHHQKDVITWAKHHAITLNHGRTGLFSVSLSAAEETEEGAATAQRYVDDLLDDTGWTPTVTAAFAGSLQYREYDFVTRMMMRLMMARGHHPTDTSKDFDYTDWAAVDAFTDRIGELSLASAAR